VREVEDIMEEVKVISWRWSLTRLENKIPTCLFYEMVLQSERLSRAVSGLDWVGGLVQ